MCIDMNKIDSNRSKKYLMGQNIYICKYGQLQNLPLFKSIKTYYNSEFDMATPSSFCDVHVKAVHPLILAKEFVQKGLNPVILTTVSHEFNGSNIEASEGMNDDILNMRTNFHRTFNNNGLYPIKGAETVYAPYVTIIRDDGFNINFNDMFRVGVIVASPLHEPKLEEDVFNLNDYYITKEIIEIVFQTAISGNHNVLILTDFGCKVNKNPLKDIVDIFNMHILNYGHMFKYIVFAFHINEQTDLMYYSYYSKEIIKPQDLVRLDEIDPTLNLALLTHMINNNA
jgi:hypothetical protein